MAIKHLDFYCERLSPDFWAEPVNAFSNLAFVAAGLWALRQALQISPRRPMLLFLSIMIIVVGIGSFLFHTFADNRTHLADLIPIFIFASSYLFYSLRHFLGWSKTQSILAMISFVTSMVLIEIFVPKYVLNGSLLYAPPLIMLFYVSLSLRLQKQISVARAYLVGSSLFAVSLCMRSIDTVVCDFFPLGTHFMWHTLNGLCLGVLMAAAFKFVKHQKNGALDKL